MNTRKFGILIERLKTIHFSPSKTAPFLLFLACFFCFGLMLSKLGFFQDDWHHVYYAYHEGIQGLKSFFYTDSRPLAYWLYAVFFRILGFDPAGWHWSLMLLRFFTSVGFWLTARLLWPDEQRATWLALFFALHPVYTLQPLAVAYTLHWVSYLAVMFSFALMLFSVQARGKSRWLFWGAALVLELYHLVMMEYFSGLELVRVLFLWISLSHLPWKERIKHTLRLWLPYLLVLLLYAAYRLSYSELFGYDRFEPALLSGLANSPFSTLLLLLQNIIRDSLYVLVSPWYMAMEPTVFDLMRPFIWVMLAVSVSFALLFFFTVSRFISLNNPGSETTNWSGAMTLFGFFSLILALLPSWLVGFELVEKNPLWSSRLALSALPGASLFLVGLAYFFIQNPTRRHLFLSILLGVAISSHLQMARNFQESWDKQRQFYWQMHWRAPALKPGTFLVADQEILFYMGDSPTAYALNLLYPKTTQPPQVDYWFNPGSANINLHSFVQGQPLEMTKYNSSFTASSDRVLAITFEPQQGQCLWLLRPTYREVRFLTEEAYRWMIYSDISRAQPGESTPPAAIFGQEPPHTWCYYYQKADLAAQLGDWAQAISLWRTASENNLRPSASVELLPFIEAYAHTSQWQQASELTLWANTLPPRPTDLLCSMWRNFQKDGLLPSEAASAFAKINDRLNCQE